MCLPVHRLPAELDRDRGRTTWRPPLPGTSHPDDPARGDLWYPRPIQSGFIRAGGSRETDRVRAELKKGPRRAPSSSSRLASYPAATAAAAALSVLNCSANGPPSGWMFWMLPLKLATEFKPSIPDGLPPRLRKFVRY